MDLVDQQMNLRYLLNQWDPIGVAEIAPDEYDCMIAPLLTRLRAGAGRAEIGEFLWYELEDHFGLDAQVIPSARDLGVDFDKLNVNGGAIAIGHPFGMTGARITIERDGGDKPVCVAETVSVLVPDDRIAWRTGSISSASTAAACNAGPETRYSTTAALWGRTPHRCWRQRLAVTVESPPAVADGLVQLAGTRRRAAEGGAGAVSPRCPTQEGRHRPSAADLHDGSHDFGHKPG